MYIVNITAGKIKEVLNVVLNDFSEMGVLQNAGF